MGGRRRGRWSIVASMATLGLSAFLIQPVCSQPASAAGTPLIGTFTITAGSCSGGVASGTYLRMVLSGGSNAAGPYFSNSDSTCSDNSYTPLSPGSAGGLVTGSYQPQPSPAFDSSGNALADQITAPVPFEGVKFATATNPTDPQTALHAPAPSIMANGTALSGNLESFGVSWNNQEFNQGSPKPGGTSPGNTAAVSGTYNPATGAYTLQWSSQIVGGPFNGFSAFWNLTGRFIASSSAPASTTTLTTSGTAGVKSVAGSGATGQPATASATTPKTGSSAASTSGGTSSGAPVAAGATKPSTAPSGTGNPVPASAPTATPTRITSSSRTTSSGQGGWRSPMWLVVLVIVLGLAGLAGVLWSEQRLRRQRFNTLSTGGE